MLQSMQQLGMETRKIRPVRQGSLKHKDPSSFPRTHFNYDVHGGTGNPTVDDMMVLGTGWPDSLLYLVSLWPRRDPVLKEVNSLLI